MSARRFYQRSGGVWRRWYRRLDGKSWEGGAEPPAGKLKPIVGHGSRPDDDLAEAIATESPRSVLPERWPT